MAHAAAIFAVAAILKFPKLPATGVTHALPGRLSQCDVSNIGRVTDIAVDASVGGLVGPPTDEPSRPL